MVSTMVINGSNVGINRGLVNLAEGPAKDLVLSVLRVGLTQAIDGVVYRQQFNIQVYAASVLGTFAGMMAAKPLASRIDEYQKNNADKEQQAQAKKAYAALLQAQSTQYGHAMYPTADQDYRDRQYQALLTGNMASLNPDPTDSKASTSPSSASSRVSHNAAAMFSRKPLQMTTTKSIAYQQRQMQHAAVDVQAQNQGAWNTAGSQALALNDPSMSSSQMLEQGIIGAGKSVYNAGIGFARTALQIASSSMFGGALPLPNDQLTPLSYSNSTQRVGGITVDAAMLLVGSVGMVEAGVEMLAARMGSRASQMGVFGDATSGTEGVEPASTDLLRAVQTKGRTIIIAKPGTEEYRYLEYINAEANVGGSDLTHILLRENPSKPAVLEEFLHGTQQKLGIIDRLGTQGAEVHVKDFMIRHQNLLGLTQPDVDILRVLHEREIDLLNQTNGITTMRGY